MKRIQRKRTKGWEMPAGTVYVGRPTKWGNPFVGIRLELALSAYRDALRLTFNGPAFAELSGFEFNRVYKEYQKWLRRFQNTYPIYELTELRGKNLACWCPLDQPCHADILLEIANS